MSATDIYRGESANLLIANEHDSKQQTLDLGMAKDIAEALNEAYPGHLWAVNVQGEQGVITIHNLMLSGRWGYVMHIDKRYSASELKQSAKRAAGEILERYNVARGKANFDSLAAMKTNRLGEVIGDVSR